VFLSVDPAENIDRKAGVVIIIQSLFLYSLLP